MGDSRAKNYPLRSYVEGNKKIWLTGAALMLGSVINFFSGFKALLFSQVTCAIGLVLEAKGKGYENRKMEELCGENWEDEWYNYYEIQANDPFIRAINFKLVVPARILIFLGSISITGGWNTHVIIATLLFSVLLIVSDLCLKDRVKMAYAAWVKEWVEAERFKESHHPSTISV